MLHSNQTSFSSNLPFLFLLDSRQCSFYVNGRVIPYTLEFFLFGCVLVFGAGGGCKLKDMWWGSITCTKGNRYSCMWKSYHLLEMSMNICISCCIVLLWLITLLTLFHFLHAWKLYHVSFVFPFFFFPKIDEKGQKKRLSDHVLIHVNVNSFFQQGFNSSLPLVLISLFCIHVILESLCVSIVRFPRAS